MTTKEIWMLPVEQRIDAFIERWLELDEHTGNRTLAEHGEMKEIADAIMAPLIGRWGSKFPDVASWMQAAPQVVKDAFGLITALNALRSLQNECFQMAGRYDGAMDAECKQRLRSYSGAFGEILKALKEKSHA